MYYETVMKRFMLVLAAASTLLANENVVTSEEAAQGWIALFDGETLSGWEEDGSAKWRVADGVLIGDSGDYGWLRHGAMFADFELKAQFRTSADGNSGIFIRCQAGGAPHVTGYEVQIFDKHAKFPTGSMVGHIAAKGGAIKPGEWQTIEISAIGSSFVVKLDGATILEGQDGKTRTGHVGLQYNKDKKVEFRGIKLRPVGLKPVAGSAK